MKANTRNFGEFLNDAAPRLAKKTPDGVVKALNVPYRGWQRIGLLRYLVAIIFMASLPILMEKDIIPVLQGSFGINILFITGYWILLTLGLSVVVGLAGLLDLGYVAFFMLGAYTTALMTDSGSPEQFHIVVWPTWAALPFAVLVSMAAGLLIGAPTLRLRGDYLAIVTLGFHEIVRQSASNLEIVNASRGIAGVPSPAINLFGFSFDFGLDNEYYWWFLLIPAILAAVVMIKRLDHSRVGRYWTAIREDEVAAAAMGVPVVKMKLWAFVIGASTSGIAGWIYAVNVSYVAPNSFPLLQSILVLCAVVIGGLGSISGAVLGAVLIVTLPEVVRQLSNEQTIFGFDPETGRIAIFGLALIIVMIYRPGGLLAARRRRTELSQAGHGETFSGTGDATFIEGIATGDSTSADEIIDDRPAGEDHVH